MGSAGDPDTPAREASAIRVAPGPPRCGLPLPVGPLPSLLAGVMAAAACQDTSALAEDEATGALFEGCSGVLAAVASVPVVGWYVATVASSPSDNTPVLPAAAAVVVMVTPGAVVSFPGPLVGLGVVGLGLGVVLGSVLMVVCVVVAAAVVLVAAYFLQSNV